MILVATGGFADVTMIRIGKPTWMQKFKLLSLPDAENEKTG